MAIWSRLTGAVAGIAIGGAGAAAVEPVLEVPKQKAWLGEPNRILDLGTLAHLVATGLIDETAVVDEAKRNGYSESRLRARIQLELKAPPVAEALELWRRNGIKPPAEQTSKAQVEHALAKAGIERQYWAAILELYNEPLDPAVVAVSIQRGTMTNPGLLPVGPPSAVGVVEPMPVSALDPIAEVNAAGINRERLAIMTRNVGLPPAPGELLQLLNRGQIEEADFYRGVSEGNTRNEWGPSLLKLRRRILTPHEYAELRLRGWIEDQAMYDGAALSGLDRTDTHLLFELLGRPIPVHQVTTGLARGGVFGGAIDQIPEAYLRSLQEGNQRPEWYSLSYANRYSLPSPFVMRGLTQSGVWSADKAETRLLWAGWIPEDAHEAALAWSQAAGGAGKPATPKLLTAAQQATLYDAEVIDRPTLTTRLENLGYTDQSAERYVEYIDAQPIASARTAILTRIHNMTMKGQLTLEQAQEALTLTDLPFATQVGILAQYTNEWAVIQLAQGGAATGPA